jgi:glutamate dehydrogenase
VIVEGANLFVTPEARLSLSRAGVVVVKDSSANKCGVICSSFEICGSMLVSAAELLAEKPRFVSEVLAKLRMLAEREAALLFREAKRQPQCPLPELSVAVSRAIARVNDAVLGAHGRLESAAPETVNRIVRDHLPQVLVEMAGDHLGRLPAAYRAGIVAASLATHLVYREGLSFVEGLPEAELGQLAFSYLQAEDRCAALAKTVELAQLENGAEIVRLLLEGGPRVALM